METRFRLACNMRKKRLFGPYLVLGAIVFFLYSIIALCLPAGAGLDEPMHISRVAQIARGEFLPHEVQVDELTDDLVTPASNDYKLYGGALDAAVSHLVNAGNRSFYNPEGRLDYDFPVWDTDELETMEVIGEGEETRLFPNTAINSPIAYLPQSLMYFIASHLTLDPWVLIALTRIGGIIFSVAVLVACMHILPFGQMTLFFIAVLPTSAFTFAAVTADTVTFSAACLYIAVLMRMIFQEKFGHLELVVLGGSLITICLSKMSYVPFGLLLFALPAVSPVFRSKDSLIKLSVIGFVSLAFFILWYLLVREINTGVMWSSDIDPDAQKQFVVNNPILFVRALVLSVLSADLFCTAPHFVPDSIVQSGSITVIFLLVALVSDLYHIKKSTFASINKIAVVGFLGFVIGLCILAIYAALYLQFTPPAFHEVLGVQTRYFLPLLLPMYLLFIIMFCECGVSEEHVACWDSSELDSCYEATSISYCLPMLLISFYALLTLVAQLIVIF